MRVRSFNDERNEQLNKHIGGYFRITRLELAALHAFAYLLFDEQQQLAAGVTGAKDGADQLKTGLQSAANGSKQLVAGLTASAASSSQLADGAQAVAAGLQQLIQTNPAFAQNEDVQKLLKASQSVANGSAQLHNVQQQLLEGGKSLNSAQQRLVQGAQKLSNGQQELNTGMKQFNSKLVDAASGGKKLVSGVNNLDQGAAKLQNGLEALKQGFASVVSGADQLNSGAGELQTGAVKLVDGSGQLATKLGDAAVETANVTATDKTVDMFASPVKVTENGDRKIAQYGTGIAPYFISMALFVGGVFFTTVTSAREAYTLGASRMGRFASRTLTFVSMSVVQSLIVDLILLYVIRLKVINVPMFVLVTLVASLTFTMIVQMLVTWLDQPGRFLLVVLMILQLSSSGGTFPIELLPSWMQSLNPWLPMSHSIAAFKDVISSGNTSGAWEQIGTLSIFLVVCLALSFTYFITRGRDVKSKPEMTVSA